MSRTVIDSYYVDLDNFEELIVYGISVKDMLLPCESALDINKRVYLNLVHVFYSNMKISVNRLDRIITDLGGVPIEFDVEDLNNILGTPNSGHQIYTSRKAFSFVDFVHHHGVKNICRCRKCYLFSSLSVTTVTFTS